MPILYCQFFALKRWVKTWNRDVLCWELNSFTGGIKRVLFLLEIESEAGVPKKILSSEIWLSEMHPQKYCKKAVIGISYIMARILLGKLMVVLIWIIVLSRILTFTTSEYLYRFLYKSRIKVYFLKLGIKWDSPEQEVVEYHSLPDRLENVENYAKVHDPYHFKPIKARKEWGV